MNQNANTLENLELIFPDSSAGKTSSIVLVELLQAGNLLKSIAAIQENDWLWKATGLNTLLNPGMLYDIKVTTDFSSTIMFEPAVLPFTEDNGIVYIASGSYTENGNQVSGAYPYVNFEFASAIGIEEDQMLAKLIPNPATDFIQVQLNGVATLEVWDIQGKLVLSKDVRNQQRIDVSNMSPGVYVYKVTNSQGVSAGKLIKE